MTSRLLLCLAALWLGGCATLGDRGTADPAAAEFRWEQRRAGLEQIAQFTLQARLASSGSLGSKADLHWRQLDRERFELRLSGPFGAGAVSIAGGPERVEVRTRDGSQFTTDPEQWIRERIGWALPVSGLRYWVIGLPAPGSPARIELNALGEIAVLQQDGWTLEYQEYQEYQSPGGGPTLPRRLQLAGSEVSLRLIADRWTDLAPEPVTPRLPQDASPLSP